MKTVFVLMCLWGSAIGLHARDGENTELCERAVMLTIGLYELEIFGE